MPRPAKRHGGGIVSVSFADIWLRLLKGKRRAWPKRSSMRSLKNSFDAYEDASIRAYWRFGPEMDYEMSMHILNGGSP